MKILFDNIVNGDCVNHKFLLVSGKIINSRECFDNSFSIEVKQRTLIRNETVKSLWPVLDNHFKCVISLEYGENVLHFNFHSIDSELSIYYLPVNPSYKILPIYFILQNSSGHFQAPPNICNSVASACNRIITGLYLCQTLIAECLIKNDLPRKSFCLTNKCHIFQSKMNEPDINIINMNDRDLWRLIGKEILKSIPEVKENLKCIVFLSFSNYYNPKMILPSNTSEVLNLMKGYVSLGRGNIALFTSSSFYTWPENSHDLSNAFYNDQFIDRRLYFDLSLKSNFSDCFFHSLGAVAHELGHLLGLNHTNNGIMSENFAIIKYLFKVEYHRSVKYPIYLDYDSSVYLTHSKLVSAL